MTHDAFFTRHNDALRHNDAFQMMCPRMRRNDAFFMTHFMRHKWRIEPNQIPKQAKMNQRVKWVYDIKLVKKYQNHEI